MKEKNESRKVKKMKLNILNYASAAILAAHTFSGISAQESNRMADEEPLPTMPMQFSIAYPISSMGAMTKDYRYNLSFNLFTGMVGAVTGVEYGAIFNNVERDMTGVQFAGIGNKTREMTGVQFGGIFNISSNVKGVQFGGVTNMTKDVSGIQFGGIANISGNIANGIQFGGIGNLSGDVDYGIQFGGIANVSRNVNGIQFGGIANVTESTTGVQFGGIGNVNREFSGVGFGGIFNRTETLNGVQFGGIVNVIDTIESGVSIALINIVRKGFYRAWEFSFADYMNVGVSFKMGTQKFYTVFSAGATFMEDNLWVTGIGFGNRTTLSNRIDFQPEFVCYQYLPNDFKHVRSTWSNHLKLGFVYKLNDKLGIAVAPSIYQFYAEDDGNGKFYKVSPVSPFYEKYRTRHYQEVGGKSFTIPSHVFGFGAGISIGILFNY